MSLTANPLKNCTSANGDISSQKTFQNFGATLVASSTQSYANAGNYLPYVGNVAAVSNLLANKGLAGIPVTAVVFSTGEQEVWITRDPVPTSGFPSGTTRFTKAYFSGNENIALGDLTQLT